MKKTIGRTALALLPCCLTPDAFAGSAAGEAPLESVTVVGDADAGGLPPNLPANSAGYSARELEEQVNVIDTSDIVKYSPDTMTRKRYIGDRNAIIETRTASVTSSARSLVYVDGVLISNLLGNGYAYPPRWNMVMPEELSRVDFFFGPYSAEYPGNSIGTTVFMSTRMPTRFLADAKLQGFSEAFSFDGHGQTYDGGSASAMLGGRNGRVSWLVGFDHLDSHGHPMTFAQLGAPVSCTGTCAANTPAVSGAGSYTDPYGKQQSLIGAQSIDHTRQDTFKLKLGLDLMPGVEARYTLGAWENRTFNAVQSWIVDGAGNQVAYSPSGDIQLNGKYYALGTAFSQNRFEQEHWMNALSLRSDRRGPFDWEAVASNYRVGHDRQTSSLPQGTTVTGAGGSTRYFGQLSDNPYGDGWKTLELSGWWRPGGAPGKGAHEVSFGYHYDRYALDSSTWYNTTANDGSWQYAETGLTQSGASHGRTGTEALYTQDSWRFAPDWRVIGGLRGENWRAGDGYNSKLLSGNLVTAHYADRSLSRLSPKLALEDSVSDNWTLRMALGQAYRFPTVTELFQSISTGSTLVVNDPALRPEDALTSELTAMRGLSGGELRASIFEEDMRDALFSQTTPVAGAGTLTAVSNIDRARTRGLALAYQQVDVGLTGLDLTGNITYAKAVTLRDALNPSYEGKTYPGVPRWRATAVATFRPQPSTAWTVAARYSGEQSIALDNSDINHDTYTSNSTYLVVDTRVLHDFGKGWKVAFGIDNLFDTAYFAYHPMNRRTVHAELKYQL